MTNTVLTFAQNTDTTFSHVPIIDLANILSEDSEVKKKLVRQVRDACINVGFLYIKNHGIPQETIDNALQKTKEFFALPIEDKAELEIAKSPNFKGYGGVLTCNADPAGRGDIHEGFELGWEALSPITEDLKREKDGVMAGQNVWPTEDKAPGFRAAMLNYYHAVFAVGKTLLPLFALALDLPANFFDDKTQNPAANMRVIHYPPQTGPVDDRLIGIGAHTDFQCFTILWQEPGIQALQVLNADNKWIKVPPLDGTLVVNLGDQFARWTNDVFKATVHRAINRSGVHRYSIPMFFGTDYDVLLEPIASCVSAERPARYEVMTAGEYVKKRLVANFPGEEAMRKRM